MHDPTPLADGRETPVGASSGPLPADPGWSGRLGTPAPGRFAPGLRRRALSARLPASTGSRASRPDSLVPPEPGPGPLKFLPSRSEFPAPPITASRDRGELQAGSNDLPDVAKPG